MRLKYTILRIQVWLWNFKFEISSQSDLGKQCHVLLQAPKNEAVKSKLQVVEAKIKVFSSLCSFAAHLIHSQGDENAKKNNGLLKIRKLIIRVHQSLILFNLNMKSYIQPTIDNAPDRICLHTGTNNVFLSLFLDDKTLALDIFSSCSFIPRAHFETS